MFFSKTFTKNINTYFFFKTVSISFKKNYVLFHSNRVKKIKQHQKTQKCYKIYDKLFTKFSSCNLFSESYTTQGHFYITSYKNVGFLPPPPLPVILSYKKFVSQPAFILVRIFWCLVFKTSCVMKSKIKIFFRETASLV
jgi:hypothetical protein